MFLNVFQVVPPSLETLNSVTPLTSSRPSASSRTDEELVTSSRWLSVKVPLGASLSTMLPLVTVKTRIASLSSWFSRATSDLSGLS